MKSISEILMSESLSPKDKRVSELIGYLYLDYILPWYKSLRFSHEYKIARDLVRLKRLKLSDKLRLWRLQTPFIKSIAIEKKFYGVALDEAKLNTIQSVVKENEHFVEAIVLLDLARKDASQDATRWIWSTILTALATIAGFITALVAAANLFK